MDKRIKKLQTENILLREENLKLLNQQYHDVAHTSAYQELLKSRQEAVLEVFNLRSQLKEALSEVQRLKEVIGAFPDTVKDSALLSEKLEHTLKSKNADIKFLLDTVEKAYTYWGGCTCSDRVKHHNLGIYLRRALKEVVPEADSCTKEDTYKLLKEESNGAEKSEKTQSVL